MKSVKGGELYRLGMELISRFMGRSNVLSDEFTILKDYIATSVKDAKITGEAPNGP
jgi:hypothetical protein